MERPPQISKRDRTVAIKVLMQSRAVRRWVESEAAFLKLEKGTKEYEDFSQKAARAIAERLIR